MRQSQVEQRLARGGDVGILVVSVTQGFVQILVDALKVGSRVRQMFNLV
jgi:hypothetical protein